MMGRLASSLVVAGLMVALLGVSGCAKRVTVTEGEIVVCTEGHVIEDDTREVEVPASQVSRYTVETRTETCELHRGLASLLSAARAALDAGDADLAKAKLAEVLDKDPSYRDAKALLDRANKQGSPAKDGASDPGENGGDEGKPKPGETPDGPVLSLIGFVPDSLRGFSGQGLVADPFVLTRMYVPGSSGPVVSLTVVAEQFKDARSAKAALDRRIKPEYPLSASTFKAGKTPVYFGARKDLGAVAFTSGAVLVVAEGATAPGKGASSKATLTDVAEQIAP